MDEQKKKHTLQMFTYGLYILTSKAEDKYCGSTVTWVSQASFKPPMISVCIKRNSHTYKVVSLSGQFILHILGESQKQIAASFFKQPIIKDLFINNFEFVLKNDMPALVDIPAYMICKVIKIVDEGDHPLFLAEVHDVNVNDYRKPLELNSTGWKYGG